MRVLHVISDENIGGAGVLLTSLLRNFDRERVESTVALPAGSALIGRVEALGVPIRLLHAPADRYSTASVREISDLIRETGSDLVHANAALNARIAGRRCGVGVLHTRHCCFPVKGFLRFPLFRVVCGLGNRMLSDRVIATAEAAAQNLRELGIGEGQIDVVINGSEPVREVGETELAAWRQRWGLREDDFVVGICARLEEYKGHETFLRAARLLLERRPQRRFRFLIVGEGSRRTSLERMAEELEIFPWVVFCGFMEDMAPIYRLLRVNVNCSSGTETSCLALSEGMSAALPSVVSDFGGNRAMMGESDAGFVIPVGDFAAVAEAIERIACDAELEKRMRDAARVRYLERYTAKSMADQVTVIYEKLMKDRS
ncbi:MAG: glycosyltransferase [Clostridia bacterium]|nr:glycosyltransferase [Clostridia bacterium]